jgi:deoxyribonuclease-4
MRFVGAHVSAAGGVGNAPLRAREIGATAVALHEEPAAVEGEAAFRGDFAAFATNCAECGFGPEQVLPWRELRDGNPSSLSGGPHESDHAGALP